MLIFGHPIIPCKSWHKAASINDIENTPSDSIIVLNDITKDNNIAIHCKENDIEFACKADSIYEAVLCSALGASYVLCYSDDVAVEIQKIANEYLWMTKVIEIIENEKDIERVAKLGVDGVIFKNFIA